MESPQGLIPEFNAEFAFSDPLTGFDEKSLTYVVVDQEGTARHQNRVKLVSNFALYKRLEYANGTTGLIIMNSFNEGSRGRLLKICYDHKLLQKV